MDNQLLKERTKSCGLLTITGIFNVTLGASYRSSGVAACAGTKAEMNAQQGCPAPEGRGGAVMVVSNGCISSGITKRQFLCRLTYRRDAAAQAKPLISLFHPGVNPVQGLESCWHWTVVWKRGHS